MNHDTPSPAGGRKVLLIDDDLMTRAMLTEALQEWLFTTVVATNLQRARDVMASKGPFTIIVCGYRLIDGHGLDFLDWLRRETRSRVPFLLLVGVPADLPAATDDYDYLAKPFHLWDFSDRMERLIRKHLPPAEATYPLSPTQVALAAVFAQTKTDKTG